jgi:uncharacterized repeat protein (TIGR03943 family)
VSDRRLQGTMLLVVAATALWLGLSEVALAYVRAALRPPLVASGLALLVLALVALLPWPAGEPAGHGHAHGEHGPRSAWLLLLPVLVLLLVAPPALGSYAASRQAPRPGGARAAADVSDFPPLPEPVDGAVPLLVNDFVNRALHDRRRSLEGERVRLVGFVVPGGKDGGREYRLARFSFFCCAADAEAYQLVVRGDAAPRRADQWLLVEGRWLPRPVTGQAGTSTEWPVLVADSVATVRAPADRYEHGLAF